MKDGKVTEASVKKLLKKWRRRLGLDDRWSIGVTIHRSQETWNKDDDVVAFVVPEIGYFKADMEFNAPAIEGSDESLESIVVHELVHIVLRPLAGIAQSAMGDAQAVHFTEINESVTETITRALTSSK